MKNLGLHDQTKAQHLVRGPDVIESFNFEELKPEEVLVAGAHFQDEAELYLFVCENNEDIKEINASYHGIKWFLGKLPQ